MDDLSPPAPARDLIGYGPLPPHAAWPGGARIAVNFVLNMEEGAEYSVGDGDGRSETALTEVAAPRVPPGDRDLAAESMYEYGARAGFWRLARLFQANDMKLTVFACALALERNPLIARHIVASGWDVCCHGYRWVEHYRMDEATERAQIRAAIASLQRSLGERPLGWYCRYAPSTQTRALLIEEGGFLYDSDSYADDLPYFVPVGGRRHLVVPYSLVTNDAKLAGSAFASDAFFALLRDAFDVLYAEGAERPRMMSVGMHPRILGQPARIAGLARFMDHLRRHDRVWVCRRLDIARHWAATFATG
jgi:peptidoglycan/xylan/chitin deacetylase (PgdA/CDA1 family)